MPTANYYASIAIVEVRDGQKINIESISISKGECVLSGAWNFPLSERETVLNVISGHLIVVLGDVSEFKKYIDDPDLVYVDASPFLEEARNAAQEAMDAYEAFKAANPQRKKMVAPDFYEWPTSIDFNNAAAYLESKGRMATPASTPVDMKKTLSAANLVKYLVDKWHSDEQERNNRKYVERDDAEMTILPKSWLTHKV